MPMYSSEGGFTGSAKGSASKSKSTAAKSGSVNRSSAPNAAAAAASARLAAGNAGKRTVSGVGNQMGRSTNTGGTVNAAAANANRVATQNARANPSSAGGKGNFGGGPSVSERIAAALGLGGGTSSPGKVQDRMPGMTQPTNGFGALSSLQKLTAPGAGQPVRAIVAGDPQAQYGGIPADAQNPSFAKENYVKDSPSQKDQSRIKDQSRVPSAPTSTASYQNPARSFPSRVATPVAASMSGGSYQNPARAFPGAPTQATSVAQGWRNTPNAAAAEASRKLAQRMAGFPSTNLEQKTAYGAGVGQVSKPQSPMVGDGATFRSPASAQAYNNAAIHDMADARFAAAMSGYSPSTEGTPAPDRSIYGDAPQKTTVAQRMAHALTRGLDKRTAGARKLGDKVNAALGGNPYNDLYGTASQGNPNARDDLNTSGGSQSAQLQQLVAAAQSGDPAAQEALKKWFIWNQWQPGQRPANV